MRRPNGDVNEKLLMPIVIIKSTGKSKSAGNGEYETRIKIDFLGIRCKMAYKHGNNAYKNNLSVWHPESFLFPVIYSLGLFFINLM